MQHHTIKFKKKATPIFRRSELGQILRNVLLSTPHTTFVEEKRKSERKTMERKCERMSARKWKKYFNFDIKLEKN